MNSNLNQSCLHNSGKVFGYNNVKYPSNHVLTRASLVSWKFEIGFSLEHSVILCWPTFSSYTLQYTLPRLKISRVSMQTSFTYALCVFDWDISSLPNEYKFCCSRSDKQQLMSRNAPKPPNLPDRAWKTLSGPRRIGIHETWRIEFEDFCKGDGWSTPRLTRPKDHNIRHRRILPNTTLYA
jgi:hypothetical protein